MNFPNFQALADYLNKEAGRVIVDPDNPTYEGQQLVNKWLETNKKTPQNPDGYDVPEGGNTDKYLRPHLKAPPVEKAPTERPPADVPPTPQTETDSSEEDASTQPTKPQNQKSAISPKEINENMQKVGGSILAGWTPIVASSLSSTRDPSGQAAGWRNQAAHYAQNAAENAKIMQWNKQRATDNTLADKVAAAQAHEK